MESGGGRERERQNGRNKERFGKKLEKKWDKVELL